jgi:hypothetical protein
MVRSCFVAPGNGPEMPTLKDAKRRNSTGDVNSATRNLNLKVPPHCLPGPSWAIKACSKQPEPETERATRTHSASARLGGVGFGTGSGLCPTPIAPPEPSSAPTSTRDEPHVGTHVCARPLMLIQEPEFLDSERHLKTDLPVKGWSPEK